MPVCGVSGEHPTSIRCAAPACVHPALPLSLIRKVAYRTKVTGRLINGLPGTLCRTSTAPGAAPGPQGGHPGRVGAKVVGRRQVPLASLGTRLSVKSPTSPLPGDILGNYRYCGAICVL